MKTCGGYGVAVSFFLGPYGSKYRQKQFCVERWLNSFEFIMQQSLPDDRVIRIGKVFVALVAIFPET